MSAPSKLSAWTSNPKQFWPFGPYTGHWATHPVLIISVIVLLAVGLISDRDLAPLFLGPLPCGVVVAVLLWLRANRNP